MTTNIYLANNTVIWNREFLTSDYLNVSSDIILQVTDEYGAITNTFPFFFTPHYLPEISELSSSNNNPAYIGFYQCM